MANFGQYETAGELARSALADILAARRPGDTGPARYVVKRQRPGGALDEAPEAAVERFLDAARTQRAMGGSRSWAPIHDAGESDAAAYYVTDRYHLHAGQLIHGWVHLREPALLALVRSVAEGLIDLEKSQGRPHGNLKPTNVLLTRSGRSERMRAALTDPLAASRLRDERDVKKDVRAVGELLYGLVTHREYAGDAAWPIECDASWSGLGRAAKTWCDLCNALLAPAEAGTERMTLAELAETLEQMTRRRRRRRLPVAAAGLAALVAALAMGPALVLRSGPCGISAAEAREQLDELWAAMGRDGTLRDLESRLGGRPDESPCLPELAGLAALLRSMREAHGELVAGIEALRGPETFEFFYFDHLGSGSQAALSEEEICGIHRAWLSLERIRDALSRWNSDDQAGWDAGLAPLLVRFDDLVTAHRPPETPAQWRESLVRVRQSFASPGLDEICRQAWGDVAGLSGDDVLAGDLCLYLLRREQAAGIENALRAVDEQAARRVSAARIPAGIPAGPAREVLRRWVAGDVAAVASGLDRRALLAAADAPAVAEARRVLELSGTDPRRWRACDERLRRAEETFADLAIMRDAIAAGARLDEELPELSGRDVRTLRQLAERLAASPQVREFRALLDAIDGDSAALRATLGAPRLRD
jgi:hypothetical protein